MPATARTPTPPWWSAWTAGILAATRKRLWPSSAGWSRRPAGPAAAWPYRAPDAVLTGLETRTSSPVRLLRGQDLQCAALPGLYPCGEGAGYAGGIMTAAVDGVRCAAALMAQNAPPPG